MRRKEDRAAATHDRERVGLATVGAVRERDECTCAHLAAPAGCVFALLVVPGAARLPLRAGFCTGARHRGGRDDDPHVRCDETIARGPRAISNVLRAHSSVQVYLDLSALISSVGVKHTEAARSRVASASTAWRPRILFGPQVRGVRRAVPDFDN